MEFLGILEKDHNGGPQVSWRRTVMGTPGILEKDRDGDLSYP